MSSELDGLCCPLTLEVFEDPCTLVGDGHTYERSSIQAWLDSGKLTSPTTGATLGLGGTRLVPELCRETDHRRARRARAVAAEGDVAAAGHRGLATGRRRRGPHGRRGTAPAAAPSDPRITAQFAEGGPRLSAENSNREPGRQGFSEGGNSAKQKGASPRAARASPIAIKL